jgi:hypothetical protein
MLLAALRLGNLLGGDRREILVGDSQVANDVLIQVAATVGGHGTDSELRLERRAQLARDDDIQLGVEEACDFSRHWHTASRDAEYQEVVATVRVQVFGEPCAGVGSVLEDVEIRQKVSQSRAREPVIHDRTSAVGLHPFEISVVTAGCSRDYPA